MSWPGPVLLHLAQEDFPSSLIHRSGAEHSELFSNTLYIFSLIWQFYLSPLFLSAMHNLCFWAKMSDFSHDCWSFCLSESDMVCFPIIKIYLNGNLAKNLVYIIVEVCSLDLCLGCRNVSGGHLCVKVFFFWSNRVMEESTETTNGLKSYFNSAWTLLFKH